jgi:hypothetical protein
LLASQKYDGREKMVKVGQVYSDKDKREEGRHLKVDEVKGLYAYLFSCTPGGAVRYYGQRTRIALVNLEKRFTLRKDVDD